MDQIGPVLVENTVSPLCVGGVKERAHGATLHLLGNIDTRIVEHSWSKIQVGDQTVSAGARFYFSRVDDKHGYAQTLFIGESLIPAAMFHMKITIITGKYD